MVAVTIHCVLESKKIQSFTVSSFSPPICYEVMWLDAMILVFWILFFFFSPEILIPAFESSSPEFHVMSSAYKLNKPPKMDGSLCRVLTKCGPLEKGWQITSLFLPWEHHEQYEKINFRLKLILCLICGLFNVINNLLLKISTISYVVLLLWHK